MGEIPEGRQPLAWNDMPLADRPRGHPSTERLEIEKLRARVAKLEAVLSDFSTGRHLTRGEPRDCLQWVIDQARAALQEGCK